MECRQFTWIEWEQDDSRNSASYRFSQAIHRPSIIINVIDTYVRPIIEYAAPIRRRGTQTQNASLEASYRFGARAALRRPYSTLDPRYISYNQRLIESGLISMEDRYIIQCIVFIARCVNGDVDAPIARTIINSRIVRNRIIRHPNLFDVSQFALGSTVRNMLQLCHTYRLWYNIEHSPTTIKSNLKKAFSDARLG